MMAHSLLMCFLIVSYYMSGVMLKTWGIKWIANRQTSALLISKQFVLLMMESVL